jgi:hypothetical protein
MMAGASFASFSVHLMLRWIALQQTRHDNTITQVTRWPHRWIIKTQICTSSWKSHSKRLQALRLYYGFLEGEPLVEAAQVFYLQQIPRLQKQN